MRKLMYAMLLLFLVPLTMAVPTSLDCIADDSPYLKFTEDIHWICSLDTADATSCTSYATFNDEVIQMNPKRQEIKDVGVVDSFQAVNGLVHVTFSRTDLRDNKTVTFGVNCGGLTYEEDVTPTIKDPYVIIERTSWLGDNVGYLLGGIIIFILLVFMGYWVIQAWQDR